MTSLQGKIIIVTGAASGIGAAAARHFQGEGAKVILADINVAAGQALAATLGADFVELDVTSDGAWIRAFETGIARHGAVNGLFNSAGLVDILDDIDNMDLVHWQRALRVNITGSYLGCRQALNFMRAGGAIVNVASVYASVGGTGSLAYAAAKGGILMLTQSIAKHCLAKGYPIRCNDIQPGYIDTAGVAVALEAMGGRERIEALHPMGRFGTPLEVASLAAFLLSDDSAYINGAHYPIDGGYLAA